MDIQKGRLGEEERARAKKRDRESERERSRKIEKYKPRNSAKTMYCACILFITSHSLNLAFILMRIKNMKNQLVKYLFYRVLRQKKMGEKKDAMNTG